MSRNYLFAASSDDIALTRFIASADKVSGFLKGGPGSHLPGWHQLGRDNTDFLQQMNAHLQLSFPHAGQSFYAVRLFTNLVWQPAYIAVLGAHVIGSVPDLSTLSQARQNLDVNGYRLVASPQWTGSREELIVKSGKFLREFSDALLVEINRVTKLKRVPALRLLTDRMLSLMVRLRDYVPGISVCEQHHYCALWLDAMGLTGQGALETITFANGQQAVITARKGCCLDYLAFPGAYCASCPKPGDDVRRQRQRADAMAELGLTP